MYEKGENLLKKLNKKGDNKNVKRNIDNIKII